MLPSKIEDIKNLFKIKFEDTDDGTKLPKDTNRVRPLDLSFDPSKITGFSSVIDSVFEAPQSFRNLYMNGISPTALQTLAESGQTEIINKLSNDFDISAFVRNSVNNVSITKTLYDYAHSEKKLNTQNLSMNLNPLNIFQSILNIVKKQKHKDYSEEFYDIVNLKRRDIYYLNTQLYELIYDKFLNMSEIKDKKYIQYLLDIYTTDIICSYSRTIYTQVSNIVDNLNLFYNALDYEIKFIKRSDLLNSYLKILEKIIDDCFVILKTEELKYVYEDIKELRKLNDNSEYSEI